MAEFDEPISDRELDVLSCLAEGASNREIAQELSISHNTVKVHLRNIYTKLGVSSRTEATTVALQKGLLSIPGIEVETEQAAEAAATDGSERDAGGTGLPESVSVEEEAPPATGSTAVETGPTDPISVPLPAERAPANRPLLLLVGFLALVATVVAIVATSRVWSGDDNVPPTPAAVVPAAVTATVPAFAEEDLGANWRRGLSLPEARSGMAVASVGLNVYQIGGETDDGVVNTVSVYDTQTQRWLPGQPKITAVADAAAAVLGGEIYVVGGRLENGQATGVVEAYSPLNDGWRPVVPLPQPLMGAVAVADSDVLYLFGGKRGGEMVAAGYRFDPARQQWEEIAAMETARVFASAGLINGQPHVVGGSDGEQALASCERFDPATGAWLSCPGMQVAREAAAAAVVLNELYVIGGTGSGGAFGEVYDPDGTWSNMEAPTEVDLAGWSHLGVTNVETRIYALGGQRPGGRADEMFIYAPLVYQFFIPAASASGDG